MAVFVKKIDKPTSAILKLTRKKDYFIIRNIFFGDTDQEKKYCLFKSLLMMQTPCASTEYVGKHYQYFQTTINQLNLQNSKPDDLIWKFLPALEGYFDCEFVIQKNNKLLKRETSKKQTVIFVVINDEMNECVELNADNELVYPKKHMIYVLSSKPVTLKKF